MKIRETLVILSILMLFLIFYNHVGLRVHASTTTTLSFSQSSYLVPNHRPFNVTVIVQNVSELMLCEIKLQFDPTRVNFIHAVVPTDSAPGSRFVFLPDPDLLSQGILYLEGQTLSSPFNGTTELATIILTVNGTATTSLSLDNSHIFAQHGTIQILNEEANLRPVSYWPDINHDEIVNIKDVMTAVIAFNSFPNTSKWNAYADVDGSGRVDLRDIAAIVANFGMNTAGIDVSGFEKLEFPNVFAENITDGWNIQITVNNTGSALATFDNSTVIVPSPSEALWNQSYAPVENFGQVTLQPSESVELQIMLPGGTDSPWQSGLKIVIWVIPDSGNVYYTSALLS